MQELIITTLNKAGLTTLMCGDGTNDVGALKQSHVGMLMLLADMFDVSVGIAVLNDSNAPSKSKVSKKKSHPDAAASSKRDKAQQLTVHSSSSL